MDIIWHSDFNVPPPNKSRIGTQLLSFAYTLSKASFCIILTKLTSKAWGIYYLGLYRKSLPTPYLDQLKNLNIRLPTREQEFLGQRYLNHFYDLGG